MTLDVDLLRAARRQRDRLRGLQDEVDRAVAALRLEVRRLHGAGGSLQEIAAALGLDDRQVGDALAAAGTAGPEPTAAAARNPPPATAPDPPPAARRPEAPGRHRTPWRLACSLCGEGKAQGRRLVAGPGVALCDRCVPAALEVLVEGTGPDPRLRPVTEDPAGWRACSFCGKELRRVGRLVQGPEGVHVCGECLDLSTEILREEAGS